MESITVLIGSVDTLSNGASQDTRREVVFDGEELAERTEYGIGRDNRLTDTRGTTETLYRTEDGRYVVHVKDWSRWQDEPTTESLHLATLADLQIDGQWEALGTVAGFGRPLTLAEALNDEDPSGLSRSAEAVRLRPQAEASGRSPSGRSLTTPDQKPTEEG